eukprot:TRINITY_DN15852_c0_g1_i1.p1 TRINITY_DN15852_c0_g1~~TRINITY_DN15852_c0_g1_i1.p1  ORF type:complete len:154 (-),score=12.22 TRINITY_DN15852_c0_g1_i1:12-473(-)
MAWQIFFFPKDDTEEKILAYCPFTDIMAEGNSIRNAAHKWAKKAKDKYGPATHPRGFENSQIISRKVWCGEKNGVSTFVLDWFDSPVSVIVCPSTREATVSRSFGESTEMLPRSTEQAGASLRENIPDFLIDTRISCTPIMRFPLSLNPNCVN